MRSGLYSAALLGAIVFAGCAREQTATEWPSMDMPAPRTAVAQPTNGMPSAPDLIVTPEQGLRGRVASVNTKLRFVVLNFPDGKLPEIDQQLALFRRGIKVGEIKVSGPIQDDNVVADIITGEAEVGDEARRQ